MSAGIANIQQNAKSGSQETMPSGGVASLEVARKVEAKKRAAIAAQNVASSTEIRIPSIPKDAATIKFFGGSCNFPEVGSFFDSHLIAASFIACSDLLALTDTSGIL